MLLSALLGTLALTALIWYLPWERELTYSMLRVTEPRPPNTTEMDTPSFTRALHHFSSHGTQCEAWLYLPKRSAYCTCHTTRAGDDSEGSDAPNASAADAAGSAGHGVCAADSACRLPVIIMAHGLGGQKDFGLQKFAETFVAAGLAVLVFDYRTFGGSEGEPRHWVSPSRHVQDWSAAVEHVTSGGLGGAVDPSRLVLWGTSFAGGHVLATAAGLAAEQAAAVKAVVSLVPHLDGIASSKASLARRSVLGTARLAAAGAHDTLRAAAAHTLTHTFTHTLPRLRKALQNKDSALRSFLVKVLLGKDPLVPLEHVLDGLLAEGDGRLAALLPAPAYVKLAGGLDELALMQLPPAELHSYYAKHPQHKLGGWQPRVLARFALQASAYSPGRALPGLPMPVLLLAAGRDILCPPEEASKAAQVRETAGLPGRMRVFDASHFDLYLPPHYADVAAEMTAFVAQALTQQQQQQQ